MLLKLFVSFTIIIFSDAFASDKRVGDKSLYQIDYRGLLAQSHIEILKYDEGKNQYLVETKIRLFSTVDTSTEWIDASDYQGPSVNITEKCQELKGKIVDYQFKSRTLKACKRFSSSYNGHIITGPVPFHGVLESKNHESSRKLISYKWSNR